MINSRLKYNLVQNDSHNVVDLTKSEIIYVPVEQMLSLVITVGDS
jgi:hypothetical protein